MKKISKIILFFTVILIGFAAFQILKNKSIPTNTNQETETESFPLKIDEPQPDFYTQTGTITVVGKTSPNSLLVAASFGDGQAIRVGQEGKFNFPISLDPGYNKLTVTVQNDKNEEKTYQADLFFDDKPYISPKVATDEAKIATRVATNEALKETVKEISDKRELAKYKMAAGLVKNYLKNVIEIATQNGSQTLDTQNDTVFVQTVKDKSAKFSDVQNGNFLVALGKPNSQNILETEAVLIYPGQPQDTNLSIFGHILKVEKGTLTIEKQNSETIELSFDEKGANPKLGQKVAIWATRDDKGTTAQKILAFDDPDFETKNATFSASPSASPSPKLKK
jgi:hypothetical protein